MGFHILCMSIGGSGGLPAIMNRACCVLAAHFFHCPRRVSRCLATALQPCARPFVAQRGGVCLLWLRAVQGPARSGGPGTECPNSALLRRRNAGGKRQRPLHGIISSEY